MAVPFSFNFIPHSEKASSVINQLFLSLDLHLGAKRKLQDRYLSRRRDAFTRIVSSLILQCSPSDWEGTSLLKRIRPLFKSYKKEGFTDEPIGYDNFCTIIAKFKAEGYLVELFRGNTGINRLKATHFFPTPKLIEKIIQSIDPIAFNKDLHFKHVLPANLVICKYKKRGRPKKKIVPSNQYQKNPLFVPINTEMQRINSFLREKGRVQGICFNGLRRIFNQYPSKPQRGQAYKFDKGGRIYPFDGDFYQGWKKLKRTETIQLTGEKVIEIDLKSSHLTIVHAQKGNPLPKDDLYDLGDGIPRNLIKLWINISLSNAKVCTRWSHNVLDNLRKDGYTSPIDAEVIAERAVKKYPFLLEMKPNEQGWGTLQYLESKILLKTMIKLAEEHKIPTLPVHDSLISPISKQDIVAKTLQDIFKDELGLNPRVTIG